MYAGYPRILIEAEATYKSKLPGLLPRVDFFEKRGNQWVCVTRDAVAMNHQDGSRSFEIPVTEANIQTAKSFWKSRGVKVKLVSDFEDPFPAKELEAWIRKDAPEAGSDSKAYAALVKKLEKDEASLLKMKGEATDLEVQYHRAEELSRMDRTEKPEYPKKLTALKDSIQKLRSEIEVNTREAGILKRKLPDEV